MNKNNLLLLVLLLVCPVVYAYDSIDDKIKHDCGVHPTIAYLKDLKQEIIDPNILVQAKKCGEGKAKIKIWDWLVSDSEIQGCLQQEYDYEPEYIKRIAPLIDDATVMSAGLIERYTLCVNEVRAESKGHEHDAGKHGNGKLLEASYNNSATHSQARKIIWKPNTQLDGYAFSEIDRRVQQVLQECNQCLQYSSTVTDFENAAKPDDTMSLVSKNCPGEMRIFAVKENCARNAKTHSAGTIQEGDGALFANFVIKPNEKIVMDVGGACMFGVSPIACYKE